MTIEEMKARKRELGYSNKALAKESGVPLGTVQKIFSGETKAPRMDTITALTRVLLCGNRTQEPFHGVYSPDENIDRASYPSPNNTDNVNVIRESAPAYGAAARNEKEGFSGRYTIDDYYALPDDRRAELIDGKFYDMAGTSFRHQAIIGEVLFQIKSCMKQNKRKCRVFAAPCDVQLDQDEYTMVQPDLQVICQDENLHRYVYFGAPDFVMEVLSKNNRSHDLVTKLFKYKNAGVREYWIVDPESEQIMVYLLEKEELPRFYQRNDKVPVYISDGICEIDFEEVFDEVKDIPDEDREIRENEKN